MYLSGGQAPHKPSFMSRIKQSLIALDERGGSSLPAIKKYLNASEEDYRFINAALRAGVASGLFVKYKGKYKINPRGVGSKR